MAGKYGFPRHAVFRRYSDYFFILMILKLSIVTSSAGIIIRNTHGIHASATRNGIKNASKISETISSVTDQKRSDGRAQRLVNTMATIAAAGMGYT